MLSNYRTLRYRIFANFGALNEVVLSQNTHEEKLSVIKENLFSYIVFVDTIS